MMFMMPMPPTIRLTAAVAASSADMVWLACSSVLLSCESVILSRLPALPIMAREISVRMPPCAIALCAWLATVKSSGVVDER